MRAGPRRRRGAGYERAFAGWAASESERCQLLVNCNDTASEYPKAWRLHQLFEAQAKRSPDAIAIVFGETELTYGELNARANQVARYVQSRGAGP